MFEPQQKSGLLRGLTCTMAHACDKPSAICSAGPGSVTGIGVGMLDAEPGVLPQHDTAPAFVRRHAKFEATATSPTEVAPGRSAGASSGPMPAPVTPVTLTVASAMTA